MTEPENVPEPLDVRWELARRSPASSSQVDYLLDLADLEGVDLADLYGTGYSTPRDLSSWAAHWGIDVLTSRAQARAVEDAHRVVEERREQQLKAMIADHYRAKHPGRYPYTAGAS